MNFTIPQEVLAKIQQQNQQQAAEIARQQAVLREQAQTTPGGDNEPSV